MKKLYIKTYGCQMNVYDSARMADLLAPLGYALGDAAESADMVILNTCHIREKATEKVYSELGKLMQIAAEARRLADKGVAEVTLLGQNVNAYRGEGPDGTRWGLAQLIRHLARIEGVKRLRYTTSHPRDMNDELIGAHGDVEKLMPY